MRRGCRLISTQKSTACSNCGSQAIAEDMPTPPISAASSHIRRHDMAEHFDFVIVGGGYAGAVITSRLSEDPSCRVALIEAGDRPPAASAMPIACTSLQLDPATDWMYTADPGKAGLGLNGRRVPVPRGRMLGGSSSLNYLLYVRGH